MLPHASLSFIARLRGLSCYFFSLWQRAPIDAPVRQHYAVFEALAMVVAELVRVGRLQCEPDRLQANVKLYLSNYKQLYGDDWMPQKFHYLHHFTHHIKRWGKKGLPNCFCLERKHKETKRCANDLTTLYANWDGTVLRDVTCRHLINISDPNKFSQKPGLVHPVSPSKKMLAELAKMFKHADNGSIFKCAVAARCNQWEVVHTGDVVILNSMEHAGKHTAGLVVQHVSVTIMGQECTYSLINMLEHTGVHYKYSTHRLGGQRGCTRITSNVQRLLLGAALFAS